MKCIDELSKEALQGKRVLVRAGLDLPVDDKGNITDLFRLRKAIPTLKFLSERGARIIVVSKIGRDPKETNEPVVRALKHQVNVTYVPDILGAMAKDAITAMRDGEILLLENIQTNPGEIANDEAFAKALASLADIYVNDAFPSAHRMSATMVGVPKFLPSYAGIQMRDEVEKLTAALKPEHPAFAMIGGAKFETKVPIIKLFLEKYDHVFITGALANDVFRARGLPVGRSKISDELPKKDVLEDPHFLAPVDVTAERTDGQAKVKKPEETTEDDKIVDIGPDTVAMLAPFIKEAKFIIWNGPTGLYEAGYTAYTHSLAELIAHRVEEGAQVVIGGGDTIAALQESGMKEEALGFLSTGGGAMLEFLLAGTLPGIDALK